MKHFTEISLLLSGVLCLAVCNISEAKDVPGYKPENVHSAMESLPSDLRRVAVLPLTGEVDPDAYGRTFISILNEELAKTKKFETIKISPERMKNLTGASSWSTQEDLPADFLATLNDAVHCDAVLFSEMTVFRGYAPLAMGWRLKLVDVKTGKILWATDEIFDASEKSVTRGTKCFNKRAIRGAYGNDKWASLNSPMLFGRYSLAALVALLPER
jgi:hypothetical protein